MDTNNQDVVIHDGQCGLCAHFGTHGHEHGPEMTQIRKTHRGTPEIVEECAHPTHASLHLKVNITSGCDGFTPAH